MHWFPVRNKAQTVTRKTSENRSSLPWRVELISLNWSEFRSEVKGRFCSLVFLYNKTTKHSLSIPSDMS